MKEILYTIRLHMKLSIRSKEILVHFYIVPILFYLVVGGVFSATNPLSKETLIQSMTVFAVTMGGVLGSPYANVEFYGSDIKRAYQVGKIPLWIVALGNLISAAVNLVCVSIVIFITAPIIFDAKIPSNLVNYGLSLGLIILSSTSIGTVFGLYFKSSSKMSMATQLVFLPSMMLSGIMFEATLLPDILGKIGYILPATWGFKAMTAQSMDGRLYIPMIVIIGVMLIISGIKMKEVTMQE